MPLSSLSEWTCARKEAALNLAGLGVGEEGVGCPLSRLAMQFMACETKVQSKPRDGNPHLITLFGLITPKNKGAVSTESYSYAPHLSSKRRAFKR